MYSSFDEYLSNLYSTDHHWSGYGAVDAYNELAYQVGLPKYDVSEDSNIGFDSALVFNGHYARSGLMLLNKLVDEPKLRVSNLHVERGESGYLIQDNGGCLALESGLYGEYSFYQTWYGGEKFTHIVSGIIENDNALVVSDSFGDAMRWVIADNYSQTYSVMDLFGGSENNATLEGRLGMSGAQTVFFVGVPKNYSTFMTRYPNYFE